jgi:hypothetical protein
MAQFNQHTGQTGWSDADHRQHFYDGLSEGVKDRLALTDRCIGTFDELCAAVQVIDQCYQQRQAEKKGHTLSHMPFGASSDPNTMQVDTTCTGGTGSSNNNGPKKDRASYMNICKESVMGVVLHNIQRKTGDTNETYATTVAK